jgi:hypothetical protein
VCTHVVSAVDARSHSTYSTFKLFDRRGDADEKHCKRLTTIPAHDSGFDAAEVRHCLVLIAFVGPTVIAADSRVVVRARLASRSLGWLPSH